MSLPLSEFDDEFGKGQSLDAIVTRAGGRIPSVESVDADTNPYAPSDVAKFRPDSPRQGPREFTALPLLFLRWLTVCGAAAAPSFFYGLLASDGRWLAMSSGILVFVVGYTLADWMTARFPWRSNSLVQWTLRIGYGTRIFISIVFPIGMFVDLYSGLLSIYIVHGDNRVGERDMMTELSTFLTTLVQGVLLNLVLAVYMGCVAMIIWAVRAFQGSRQ